MELDSAVTRILRIRDATPATRAVLVALSGIDGSGKGHVAERLIERLARVGGRVAAISVDDWLELPDRRFDENRPAEHFYERGIRFDEMFERLVLPLRDRRTVRLAADLADPTNAPSYRRHTYAFDDVDLILLEGIFLLKREFRAHYDLALWVECGFETALQRALARAQEGLTPEETIRDYTRIYFAAQRLHFARDDPRDSAALVIENDPRGRSRPDGTPGSVSGRRSEALSAREE
jgi:uridine kinase